MTECASRKLLFLQRKKPKLSKSSNSAIVAVVGLFSTQEGGGERANEYHSNRLATTFLFPICIYNNYRSLEKERIRDTVVV
mmetsp:Transcript_24813/g.34525  ORF Transcript_24813/g.34525 Transcript_24813/m.34525 type:complete len:81 (-) Transcript_24813:634-876(-)